MIDVAPITPDEISEGKKAYIPAEVVSVFNQLIAKHYVDGSAVVPQEEAIRFIIGSMGIERNAIFESKYLDVEPLYEGSGWKVTYDKPAYNESYPATFKFERAKK